MAKPVVWATTNGLLSHIGCTLLAQQSDIHGVCVTLARLLFLDLTRMFLHRSTLLEEAAIRDAEQGWLRQLPGPMPKER